MKNQGNEKDSFIKEHCGFGISEETITFAYWYDQYQRAPRHQVPDEEEEKGFKIVPSYAKETALFKMAAFAEDEWQRELVIQEFLEEYGDKIR